MLSFIVLTPPTVLSSSVCPQLCNSVLQDGVDLSALMELPKQQATARDGAGADAQERRAEEQPVPWWRFWRRWQRRWDQQRQQREADPNAEVVKLYNKAAWALVGRACTLLTVYYLPTYLVFGCLGLYHVRAEHTAQRRCCAAND